MDKYIGHKSMIWLLIYVWSMLNNVNKSAFGAALQVNTGAIKSDN